MKTSNRTASNRTAPKLRVCLALALSIFSVNAFATEVKGEAQRKADNTVRIARMNGYMQPKVRAVLSDLESHGYRPLIDVGVWRSPAEQREKVRRGYSKTLFSFHTATTPTGKPDSLAADITDIRWGWSGKAPRSYWLKLAASAESHELTTGIYWGLSASQRKAIHTAIAKLDFERKVALGWDVAHVEQTEVSIAQARKGIRPK